MVTTLRIKKNYDNNFDLAIKWYSIISILNDFKWSPLEIKVMAFTAIKGDISSGGRRGAFLGYFKSTKPSLANTISEMHKKHFLVKVEGKLKINPQFFINFEGDILSQINLCLINQ